MNSEEIHKNRKKLRDSKCNICILGPKNLHNCMLEYVLKREFKSCIIEADINSIPVNKTKDDHKKLLLIDCSGIDIDSILINLKSDNKVRPSFTPALFNLRPGMEIEHKAFSYGIKGFFYKQYSLELFLKGVQALFLDEIWLSRDLLVKFALKGVSSKGSEIEKKTGLTKREMEILALTSLGATNDEISEKLFISPHTVKTHLYHVFKKINVPNRLQAALWAAKNL